MHTDCNDYGTRHTGKTSSATNRMLPAIVAFFIGGLTLFAVGCFEARQCLLTRSWPTAEAEILESDFQIKTTGLAKAQPITQYIFDVRYSYQVDGVTYQNDQVSAGTLDPTDKIAAYAYRKKFPKAALTNVYYDPAHLSRSVLDTSIPRGTKYMVLGGGLTAIVSLFAPIILIVIREIHQQQADRSGIGPLLRDRPVPLRRYAA